MALITSRVVHDVHVAMIVDPQTTHNYVVDSCCHFTKGQVVATFLKFQVADVNRSYLMEEKQNE